MSGCRGDLGKEGRTCSGLEMLNHLYFHLQFPILKSRMKLEDVYIQDSQVVVERSTLE